ncbi:MAG: beta-N-acetylhexosaminidase [Proteobacteria bacterium]|nr:beta-N-acetylhexosaminidase [Pseudomonadota bacterium]
MSDKDLEKKVGQLLCVGIPEKQVSTNDLKLLNRVGVGGAILFKKNYESVAQLVELTNSLQKGVAAEAYRALPLFIGVDQEGGRVQRFGDPFTIFPAMAKVGALNSAKTAFEVGYVLGKELAAAGINLNFAPVVDVPLNMEAPGLGDRVFSVDPEVVAAMGSAVVRGIQKGGCVGVLKHFPGHGSANVDSHEDLPICKKTVEEFEALDWIPFRKCLRARAEAVMSAHIMVPAIDASKPATFSRKILQDYLRKELRHQKIIFSDDLEMGAISKRYALKDAAFLAIDAGCDMILICHDYAQIEDVWQHLVNAFKTGALSEKKLDESLVRIEDVKKKYLLPLKYASKELATAMIGAPVFKAVASAIVEGKTVENGPSTQAAQ